MLVGKVDASKSVVRAIPDSPLSRRFHTPSMEWPIGVTQPIPVMTTRFILGSQSATAGCHLARHALSAEGTLGAVGSEVVVTLLLHHEQPGAGQHDAGAPAEE